MAGKNVTIRIEGDGESARRALEMVRENLRETAEEAKREGGQITESMEMVTRALERVGIYMGIREAIDLMKEMVAGSVELGMEIGHLSKETGISAQNLSVMKYAADVTGVSFEALTKGSTKLAKTMLDAEEGKKQAINSFARLGITQGEVISKSHDLYGMLEVIADKFQKIPDGPNKAAAAMALFGKSGAALIPFLDQGAAGIEELRGQAESLGLVLDESGVARMEALHEASVRLKGGIEGAGLAITMGLEPALLQVAGSFSNATDKANGFEQVGEGLGVGLKVLISAWDLLAVAIKQTEAVLIGAGMATIDSAEGAAKAAYLLGESAAHPLDALNGKFKQDAAAVAESYRKMGSDIAAGFKVAGDNGKQFHDQMGALWGDAPKVKPHAAAGGTGDDIKVGDQSGGKKLQSTDGADRAGAALAEAQADAEAAATKSANARMLAELEAGHRQFLISDANYFHVKTLLMQGEIDAEIEGYEKRRTALEALKLTQHNDKTLKDRDANGNSAQELTTAKQIVENNQKINDLTERRGTISIQQGAARDEEALKTKLSALKLAADLEQESNRTITARLALLREETAEELARIAASSGTGSGAYAQAQALERVKEEKLKIGVVGRQITEIERDYKRAVDELNDAAAKDPRLKKAATAEINQLNRDQVAQVRGLVAQYDALAQVLGGEYLDSAKDMQAELAKLNRPNEKSDAQFAKSLGDGVETMAKRIADATDSGRNSFHKMVMALEKDAMDLAIKLASDNFLKPALLGLGAAHLGLPAVHPQAAAAAAAAGADGAGVGSGAGAGAGGVASAGAAAAAAGAAVAQTGFSKMLGGAGASAFAKLGAGGGKEAPISVQIVLQNNSSTPMAATQGGQSFDGLRAFIITTVLTDAAEGGPLRSIVNSV